MGAEVQLRELRLRAGLTQQALAKRAGTSQAAVARYESGASSPSLATLERLVRAAGAELVLTTTPAPAADLSGARAVRLRRNRREILRLAREAGATNVRVFGSVARGEDDASSDIDLLVDYDAASAGLLPIGRLEAALETLLGEPVDVSPADMLRPEVAAAAHREAVPL
jgi:predicted nucleotidyltransferase/DNA-binding XRE family transcriptional regulator